MATEWVVKGNENASMHDDKDGYTRDRVAEGDTAKVTVSRLSVEIAVAVQPTIYANANPWRTVVESPL